MQSAARSVSGASVARAHQEISPIYLLRALWAAASAMLLVRLGMRFLSGLRLARRSEPVASEQITGAIEAAKLKLQIETNVFVRSSERAHSPVIWCWGKEPLLLVPGDRHYSDSLDWESVVCHELAHWRRRDHLTGLLAELMVCALPWNPLVWVARRRLVGLSEEACDDWVIASGQVGTRYARTLLGLTPQGHVALVPAVVSSRKGLGVRVRRILADRCGNPRSGLRWSLTATSLAASLAVGIALAQAGPARSTDMIRTELAHGATIEQLASTGTILGTVLDPNGNPTPDHTTRIAVLPMTCYGVTSDDDGHFEIPWSPSWIDADQPVYLVARDGQRNLARIIEVEDPDKPVKIDLKPAVSVKGKVLDPNGRPIHQAVLAVSLPARFQCRAPIANTDTDEQGEFTLEQIPSDRTYTMEVRAEEYETRMVEVAAPSGGKARIRLDPITLVPQGPAQTVIPVPGPNADSYEKSGAVHRLSDGEVVKLIKVPFMRHRQHTVIDLTKSTGGLLDYPYIVHQYRWDGQLEDGCWYAESSGLIRIRTVVNAFLDIPSYEFELAEKLGNTHVARGDWIVRKDATTEQKLGALEEIIAAELHRPIHFEKRVVERDVIIVTGRYVFTPLPGRAPDRLCIIAEEKEHLGNDEAESLLQLFRRLANGIKTAIDNRAESPGIGKVPYSFDYDALSPFRTTPIDKEKDLPPLLDNLSKQTALTFTVEKRPMEVWFAIEDTDS